MTLCGRFGHPELFITFICNPKWPEITRALAGKYGGKAEDRPDIVSRVFKMKLDSLMIYVKSGKPFGKVIAGNFCFCFLTKKNVIVIFVNVFFFLY